MASRWLRPRPRGGRWALQNAAWRGRGSAGEGGGGAPPGGYDSFQPYFIVGASNQRGGDPDGLYDADDADLTGRIAQFKFGDGTIEDADTPVLYIPGGITGADPFAGEPQTVGPAMSLCKAAMVDLPANVRPLIVLMAPGGRGIFGGGLGFGLGPWDPGGAGPAYQLGDSGTDLEVHGCLYLGIETVWDAILANVAEDAPYDGYTVLPPIFIGHPLNENDTGGSLAVLKDRAVDAINGIRAMVGYPNATWVAYGANAEWAAGGPVQQNKINAVRKMCEENLSYYAYMDGIPFHQSDEDIHYTNSGGRAIGPLLPDYIAIAAARTAPIPKPIDWLDGLSNVNHSYGFYRGKSAYGAGRAFRMGIAPTTVTISIATPGVVTQTAHGKSANDPVTFITTQALPTGLLPCRAYYVKTVLDANTFTVSATAGGTVIDTTGSQSGTHRSGPWLDINYIDDGASIWDGEADWPAIDTFAGANNAFIMEASDSVGLDILYAETDPSGSSMNGIPMFMNTGNALFSGYRPMWGDFTTKYNTEFIYHCILGSATPSLSVGGWSISVGVIAESFTGAVVSGAADTPSVLKGGAGNMQYRLNGSQRVSSLLPDQYPAWLVSAIAGTTPYSVPMPGGVNANGPNLHVVYVGADLAINGVVDANSSLLPGSSAATVTIASPGVVTWTAHGQVAGASVRFVSTTGALPTGLAISTTYYVKTVLSANTFTLAATLGGAEINTSGSQSGTHTMNSFPTPGTYISTGIGWGGRRGQTNRYSQGRQSQLITGTVALTGAEKTLALTWAPLYCAIDAVASQAAADAIAAL